MTSNVVTSLRSQIMRLRVPVDGGTYHFVPEDSLRRVMTKEAVRDAVTMCHDIKPYQVKEVIDVIIRSALKVFAILVLLKGEEGLILRFVENDSFQKSALDARLPLHRIQLETFMPRDAVEDFVEKQWEFVVPFFSKAIIHRVLPASTRLPFVIDQDTGMEGGFGHIYEIQIHPEYHEFPTDGGGDTKHLRLVRKEFLPNSAQDGAFQQEARNLNILSQIRHPNIIEMYGSYTFRGKHNAIFPLAIGGDIATLLQSHTRPVEFVNDCAIYAALSDLSSAIEVVHTYTAERINLNLVGIHHDLKPQNILVHQGAFLLADLGLTTFKSADESSKSPYRIGGGHYLAPECEDYENGFEKGIIGRSSDIWSFGCILAEMATYMHLGADGVTAFKAARKVQIGGFTTYTFHAGVASPNLGVVEWLQNLEQNETVLEIPLIEMMLNVDPAARLTAAQVTMGLRVMTVVSYARHLEDRFRSISLAHTSHELETQAQLFQAWITSMIEYSDTWLSKIGASRSFIDEEMKSCTKAFLEMRYLLEDVRKELLKVEFRYSKATSPLFHEIRRCIEGLVNTLPNNLRDQSYTEFELWMGQHNPDILDSELETFMPVLDSSRSRKLTMLATMRRLNDITPRPSIKQGFQFHLSVNAVKITGVFEDHMIGILTRPESTERISVLVELVEYDVHWTGAVSEELLARMVAIADILRDLSGPNKLPILPCQGFYHMPQRFAFAFVYEMPPRTFHADFLPGEKLTAAWSLSMVFEHTSFSERPLLNDRYHLAYLLAVTLLDFHKAGWLHKSVSPNNVVFLTTNGASKLHFLRLPYLIGFNRSRQNLPTAFTEGANSKDKSLFYAHPQYLREKCRFRASYDYYSLGLVLLEIGLWNSLHTLLVDIEIFPPKMSESILSELLDRVVPALQHTMGLEYYQAVHACLSWDATGDCKDLSESIDTNQLLRFEKLVVNPMRQCSLSEGLTHEQRFPFSTDDQHDERYDNTVPAVASSGISGDVKQEGDLHSTRQPSGQKMAHDSMRHSHTSKTILDGFSAQPGEQSLVASLNNPSVAQSYPPSAPSNSSSSLPIAAEPQDKEESQALRSREVHRDRKAARAERIKQRSLPPKSAPLRLVDEAVTFGSQGTNSARSSKHSQNSQKVDSKRPAKKVVLDPQKKYDGKTPQEWFETYKSFSKYSDERAWANVDAKIYQIEHPGEDDPVQSGFDDPDPFFEARRKKEGAWVPQNSTWRPKPSQEQEQKREEELERTKLSPLGLYNREDWTPIIGPPRARLVNDSDPESSSGEGPSNSKDLWS